MPQGVRQVSEVPELDPNRPPPPDYYARNVRYLLDEVERRSGALLLAEEKRFVRAYLDAGPSAQRLFARLLTRSRPWIRCDSLNYPEVGDLEAALHELAASGLIARTPDAPAQELLGLFTRPELEAAFPSLRGSQAPRASISPRALTKPAWIEACVGRYPDHAIRARLAERYPWIGVAGQAAFAVCQVLFFGDDAGDLSRFVVQDLGILRYERYALDRRTRPFQARDELEGYLLCRRLSPWSSRLDTTPALAREIPVMLWGAARTRTEQRARDKVLNRVARWHERRREFDQALTCYGRASSHPARERQARLLRRLGDQAGVEALLEDIRRDPWSAEEEDFARRFPGRRAAADFPVTTCTLGGPTPAHIERHALRLLTGNGGRGWHLENLLPLGLTGLAFWDEIFAPVPGAFSNPFQLGPQDLFWPDFARSRRRLLDARLQALKQPGGLARQLRATLAAKRGTANRLVHWGAVTAELVEALLANVPHPALLALVEHTVRDLGRCRTGFPDLLLVYGPAAWELVEVKGPTDSLQPAQRTWLRRLGELGLPARVLRFRAAC
ncbi:MAG: VRR-NUC domain-containing protein [Roseibium album]|uniref:VRR-NUC domain-containing protein n=1 Tax=Roseibium album TaxID=311410 RepID=UPI0032EE63AF